jgi:crooked neck
LRLLRLLRERERARNNDKDDGICGVIAGWEEYFDYIFPDDAKPQALKILEMAQKWKKQKVQDDE